MIKRGVLIQLNGPVKALRRAALVALSCCGAAFSAAAQQPVNHERGLSAQSYLSNNFDHVNLYNGNLTLTVPIGPTYRVGGNLEYRLMLVYNSTTWNFKTELQNVPGEGAQMRTQSAPNPKANAGHGWALSLGALYPPNTGFYNTHQFDYLYVAPDGSEHRFPSGNLTKDGSFLRLNAAARKVEFPDGSVHTFSVANHQLTSMEDRFGNRVDVNMSNPAQWVIQESPASSPGYTRTHRLNFDFDGSRWRVVSAWLSAFDNPGTSETVAVYSFNYGSAPVVMMRYKDDWYRDPPQQPNVSEWMLRGVTLPAGAGTYQFEYNNFGGIGNPSAITGATLPTGGHYRWEWTVYVRPFVRPEDPRQFCNPYCPEALTPVSSSDGVLRKLIFNRAGDAAPIGAYEYNSLGGHRPTHTDPAGDAIVTVTSPAGDDTVNYFNNDLTADSPLPTEFYGLPFTPRQTEQADGQTLYLSQEFYKGARENGTKVRSVYVRYEVDGHYDTGAATNPRVVAQRTIYHDDGGRVADTFNSEWNQAGKFRETRSGGTFASGNSRTTKVNYSGLPPAGAPWILNLYTRREVNEGAQHAYTQFCFDQATGALRQKRTLKDGGGDPLPSVRDIFVVYGRDGDGNVNSEKIYGGDKSQNAPLGDVCGAAVGAPEYELAHTYAHGTLATTKYVGLNSGDEFFTVNNLVDQRTGLVSQSTDASGITTGYEYDALGRPKKVKPAEDAHVEYVYTAAGATTPAHVQIKYQLPNGTLLKQHKLVADTFGRVAEEHDPVPDNGGTPAQRKTTYNAMGWVTSVSQFGASGQKTTYSNFDPFGRARTITAPDGEATSVTYRGVSYVERTRDVGVTADATGVVSETPVKVEEFYDRQGRLAGVEEGSGAGNGRVRTDYQYDVGGRLRQVDIHYGGASVDPQTRTFNYDNRGLLTSETHPEITGAVTYKYDSLGKVTEKIEGGIKLIYAYDKAGRIVSLTDGSRSRELKTYSYYGEGAPPKSLGKVRKATRINWVQNPYNPAPNASEIGVAISEEYTYGGLGGRVNTRTTRLNDGGLAPYVFTQGFGYDRLGNLAAQDYPQCHNAPCVSAGQSFPRRVSYSHSLGYLKQIGVTGNPGAYSTLTYHSNKMLATVSHANNVTDTYAKDPHSMERVRRVTYGKTNPDDPRFNVIDWTSGDYEYDGAGNITEIGADWFTYDHANRIKEGTAGTDPQGRRYRQSYGYDPLGNVTRRTTVRNGLPPEIVNMTVDPTTNRLGGNIVYDAAGNILGVGRSDVYVYDPLNMVKKVPGKTYLYGPADERVWVVDRGAVDVAGPINPSVIVEHITLRGLNNEVLREYQVLGERNSTTNAWTFTWGWSKDYIYRGTALLASESSTLGRREYHLDHLGSARFVTNMQGNPLETMWYFPYGSVAQGATAERLRFTGHEQDTNHGPAHTLYYMHARFYSTDQGKFTSVDPGRDFDPREPQSWNRYAYVRGNPVNRTDPTGRNGNDAQPGQATAQQTPTDGNDYTSRRTSEAEFRQFMEERAADGDEAAKTWLKAGEAIQEVDGPIGALVGGGVLKMGAKTVAKEVGEAAVIGLQKNTGEYLGRQGFEVFKVRVYTWARNQSWIDKVWNSGRKIRLTNTYREGVEAVANGSSRGGFVKEMDRLYHLAGTRAQLVIEGILLH